MTDRGEDEGERKPAKAVTEHGPLGDLDNPPDAGETISDYFAFEEIFTRVLATADHELEASNKFLFWSGLAAGFALGLTFLGRIVFTIASGEETPGLLGNIMYPVGFFIIVIGRYQLFTENTLTPVVLVLSKLASIANLLRLWGVVLSANMLGAFLTAALIAHADVLEPEALAKAIEMARHAHETPWVTLFSKALISGWIVASMVWLVHAARDTVSKFVVVWFLMYFVGVGGFVHVVTSSVEVFFLYFHGDIGFWPLWPQFVAPIILGNTIGGIVCVAIVNYVQFGAHEASRIIERYGRRLSWREWAFGRNRAFGREDAKVK